MTAPPITIKCQSPITSQHQRGCCLLPIETSTVPFSSRVLEFLGLGGGAGGGDSIFCLKHLVNYGKKKTEQ